ncbi:hypothetical protein [Sphingopyxis witflariensis]|uniref:Uncharacterized protein n=1 Tax=Sphingopyxis witflariensis TaxID=173675 RepID=A0A246K668_9SPHN|nr:hypothetical protein [Sphingopyxis witflariensis]OWR01375.1 hypothetical protein CDQ91_02985 [Sphingopyxis witflariensis]
MHIIELQNGGAPDRGASERMKLADSFIGPEDCAPNAYLRALIRPISLQALNGMHGTYRRMTNAPQTREHKSIDDVVAANGPQDADMALKPSWLHRYGTRRCDRAGFRTTPSTSLQI